MTFINKINKTKKRTKSTEKKTKKRAGLHFSDVEQSLKDCCWHIKAVENESEKSLSIILEEVRLVSLNEIFAAFQTRPYALFKYKKQCHELIDKILKKQAFPVFKDEKIKITYFRQASRFFDHDSLVPSFKFFLDALVDNGVIDDDNPNIVNDIKPIQQVVKGQKYSLLGIRIERVEAEKTQELNLFKAWNFTHELDEQVIDM